jgi:hypothetical protein
MPGFARRPVLVRKTFVDQFFPEDDALRGEDPLHQRMRPVEGVARKTVGAEAVLIGHQHELETGIAQFQHRRDHARDQAQFFVRIDLEIGRFLDQGAVAIHEQDAAHAATSVLRNAPITASFSPALPTLMRSASCSVGLARMSRTTTPAPSNRAKAASASSKRTSR